jgi:hypothetical protein
MNAAPIAPRAVPTAAVGMPSSFEPRHDLQGNGIRLKRGPRAAPLRPVRRLPGRLTATRSRRRMNALGRSIHVRGKGCAHDHDRFADRDPSSSFSLVRTQARERGSACPARPIRTPPSGST